MKNLKDALTPMLLLVLVATSLYDRIAPRPAPAPSPAPTPAVNGAALGKAYGPALLSTYADAWLAAAQAVEDGKAIAEAQKALQDSWKDARARAFTAQVSPGFALVLPEGTEPSSPDKRAQVAELWRSFAKGLKGGR